MNNQLIEKVITSNNLPCPEFTFQNPLLDKNVAKALSKSFVKILNLSQQNSQVNNNLRLSILENIRKMCQIEPENHMRVDENITSLLTDLYKLKIKDSAVEPSETTDKDLDAFLIRNMLDMNIGSKYDASVNPEIVQALINLNEHGIYLETLFKDIIHWDCSNNKNIHILKNLWISDSSTNEDLSIKMKSEIEKTLLDVCHNILKEPVPNCQEILDSNILLKNIVKKSAESARCFQISCYVLNYVYIMTNFDVKLLAFISMFVGNVKRNCSLLSYSVLYPPKLGCVVVLIDIDVDILPDSLKNAYIEEGMKYLSQLHSDSESDLIMILSHFPKWFDIYFSKKMP